MWRGIIFNAIYQCFVLTIVLFVDVVVGVVVVVVSKNGVVTAPYPMVIGVVVVVVSRTGVVVMVVGVYAVGLWW